MVKFIVVKPKCSNTNLIWTLGHLAFAMHIVDEDHAEAFINDGYMLLEDFMSEHPELNDTIVDASLIPPLDDEEEEEN